MIQVSVPNSHPGEARLCRGLYAVLKIEWAELAVGVRKGAAGDCPIRG
jgi:hypothetical protein